MSDTGSSGNPPAARTLLTSLPVFGPPAASPLEARFLPPAPPPAAPADGPLRRPHRLGAASPPPNDLTGVDWGLVAALRDQASELLSKVMSDTAMSQDEQWSQGRQIISDLTTAHLNEQLRTGQPAMSPENEQNIKDAVFDALFRYGRLQPLLDRDDLEDIECYGAARVIVEDKDGRFEQVPPIADSDDELIDFIQFIVKRNKRSRNFDFAHPTVHMALDGGERLFAVAWVTPYPSVSIRRHRLRAVTLDMLVDLGTISTNLASFLRAAVRARRSIVVSGEQAAGKTTLLRALAAELDPWEKIATFETEFELFLHELGDQHHRTLAFETRPGSGEAGIDGRPAGEITMGQEMRDSYRGLVERYIVGEARGQEVLQMIEAMQSGAGTLSTTHARDARATFDKLVTLAMAAPNVGQTYASRAVALFVDIVVHVNREVTQQGQFRYVDDVVGLGWSGDGVAFTDIYRPGADGRAVPAYASLGDKFRDLSSQGFDLHEYLRSVSTGGM